jgi:hypothetical protein
MFMRSVFILTIVIVAISMTMRILPLWAEDITLKNGELIITRNGRDNVILTNTGGNVREFIISPDRHYMAYTKTIRFVPGHNDAPEINEVIEDLPVSNIVIYNLTTKSISSEINPTITGCDFIRMDGWVSKSELLLHDADTTAVCNNYIYDVLKKQLIEIDYEEYERYHKELLKKAP